MKNNYKKQIKESLESKKVTNKKGNQLYVKWKVYDNLFNSCIDEKDKV